jgi:putative ABC transport system permease protein
MVMGAQDLTLYSMISAYSLLIIPVSIIFYWKIKKVKETLLSVLRMTIQLGLVGIYLKYIFELNNIWINIAWLMVMVLVSTFSIMNSNKLNKRVFIVPFFFTLSLPLLINSMIFNGLVVRIDDIFNAKYLIPISGMLLGNTMRANIIASNNFIKYFQAKQNEYFFTLSLGASKNEALLPILKLSFSQAIKPTLASIATIGLVSLPGMMTGQILGGSIPLTAIKYQIAIMIAIYSTMSLSIFLILNILSKIGFDKFGLLRKDIFTQKNKKVL